MDITEKPTTPSPSDTQNPPGQSAAADMQVCADALMFAGRPAGDADRPHHKQSWRNVATVDPSTVASTIEGMGMVTRAVYELGELDPCLLLAGQRLRLRLLIDRMLGNVDTGAVGDAVSALYALRRRGFPVSGISEVLPPRKSRDVARRVIQDLRKKWNRTGPDKIEESLWVETTLGFLETPSRGR